LRESLAASGFAPDLRKTNSNRAEWSAFVERCQGMARMGSAAMDMCYVARGRFDLYWEYGSTAIDRSAGTLIVQEAGGTVTDCAGNPFDVIQAPCVLDSNGRVHDEAVSVLIAARQSVGTLDADKLIAVTNAKRLLAAGVDQVTTNTLLVLAAILNG